MGLRINTNVAALQAQRNLGHTTKALNKSLERLASGQRIVRAGDDAAGLAISEGLRSQVRGLRQAVRNANDAGGFLTTAEGALAEMTNIAQRLRELGIQAANGSLGQRDRGFLDTERGELVSEFNRIANQTTFNTTKLLDGTFQTIDLQVGVQKGESISFTIGDARATSLGALARLSGQQNRIDANAVGQTITLGNATQNGSYTLLADNNLDTLSSVGQDYSAIAVAAAVNSIASTTGVRANIVNTTIEINNIDEDVLSASGGFANDGDLTINGQRIIGLTDNMNQLVQTINNFSSVTGVEASLNDDAGISLIARDGRNVQVELGSVTVDSVNPISGFFRGAFNDSTNVRDSDNLNRLFTATAVSAAAAAAVDQTFTGSVELISSDLILISSDADSEDMFGFSEIVIAIDKTETLSGIRLTTQEEAQDALAYIDATLQQLTQLRSNLGAIQNRLEAVVTSLAITNENLSAAQAEIRDADMAVEVADLTRAQILQQAGVSVLGQANVSAQVALQLLQF
jgi:flagellin